MDDEAPYDETQADNPLKLDFEENIVKALWDRLNSSLGHIWPPGLSLPTSDIKAHPYTS